MTHRRVVRAGLVMVAAALLASCGLPGGGGFGARLEFDQASYTGTVGASTGTINPITVTNDSGVDDTVPPSFELTPLTGSYGSASTFSVSCSGAVPAHQSCVMGVSIIGLSSPTATFRVAVTGGTGTTGDTALITFNQP